MKSEEQVRAMLVEAEAEWETTKSVWNERMRYQFANNGQGRDETLEAEKQMHVALGQVALLKDILDELPTLDELIELSQKNQKKE